MRFEINGKDLKGIIEKGITCINKKATFVPFTRLNFTVCENGNLKVNSSINMETFLEVIYTDVYNTVPGTIAISIEDLKMLSKHNGTVKMETLENELVSVTVGKKNLTLQGYEINESINLPSMGGKEDHLIVDNRYFLDAVVNCSKFTRQDNCNKMMEIINFNLGKKRIEALDGNRIIMKTLEEQNIVKDENIFLLASSNSIFKKLIGKQSEKLTISKTDNHIFISGKDFTFSQKIVAGEYFKVDQMLCDAENFSFTVNTSELLEVMKYDLDIVKDMQKPVVFNSENNELYIYCMGRYEAIDQVETKNITMDDNMLIAFNPAFLKETMEIADSDSVRVIGVNSKAPIRIFANEYEFLILPANYQYSIDKIKQAINRVLAA